MVQLPEVMDEEREAYKEGYRNICEIGKERVHRPALAPSDGADDPGGVAADAGKRQKRREIPRHLAAVLADDDLHRLFRSRECRKIRGALWNSRIFFRNK